MYFLFLTAITVSIDSFICGFSLALKGGKKSLVVILITLTVFLMCLITNYLAEALSSVLTEETASLSGLILIGVGTFSLLKKEQPLNIENRNFIKQVLLSGFAVGVDGALANLSLSLMGYNQFYVPIIIAVMHGAMIGFGILLSENKISKKIAKVSFIAPLILILLGIYKLLGLFL